jgi:polyphosphate glucokinase
MFIGRYSGMTPNINAGDWDMQKKVLTIDVGGTNVKMLATGHREVRKFPSGPELTPKGMVAGVLELAKDWDYDVITIGYPGPVVDNRPIVEPHNIGKGWVGYSFERHLGRPVRMINDAAMQALGSYGGGRMLFLGLGTGLGSALIIGPTIAPLELAHLPYKKGNTFEDYAGQRGYDRLGKRKWTRVVHDIVARLKAALMADYVVLGGGNTKKLQKLPKGVRLGSNYNAFRGGFRLWERDVD